MLAALRDRVMLPDGRLVPWRSPNGHAAAARRGRAGDPVDRPRLRDRAERPHARATRSPRRARPSTRSASSRHRSRTRSSPRRSSPPAPGSRSASRSSRAGRWASSPRPAPIPRPTSPAGSRAPTQGEPYDDADGQGDRRPARALPLRLLHRLEHARRRRCSSASGFTDDLFPVDEALRFANRTRRDHPGTPLSLLLGDFGHQRAANKPADRDAAAAQHPRPGSTTTCRGGARAPAEASPPSTQTCPRGAPSGAAVAAPDVRRSSRAARCASPARRRRRCSRPAANPATAPSDRPGGGRGRRLRHHPRRDAARARRPIACRPRDGLHPARRARGDREAAADAASPASSSSPRGFGTWRRRRKPDARRARPLPAVRRGRATASSCTPTAGGSRRGTCRSSSCSATTPPYGARSNQPFSIEVALAGAAAAGARPDRRRDGIAAEAGRETRWWRRRRRRWLNGGQAPSCRGR